MKVTFYNNIKTMSGYCKAGNMVFMSVKNDTLCYVRKYTYPTITTHNNNAGNKLKAAAKLWKNLPIDFVADLKRYTAAYNSQLLPIGKGKLSAYNIFVKAVCKLDTPMTSVSALSGIIGSTIEEWIDMDILNRVQVKTPFEADIT